MNKQINKYDKFFMDRLFSFGLVTRCTKDEIDKIIAFFQTENVDIVYDKISTQNLWIKEGGDKDE